MVDMNQRVLEVHKELQSIDWIEGCITGSSLLDNQDFNSWASKPDVDVFVYSDIDMAMLIEALLSNGWKFGTDDSQTTSIQQQELFKKWRKSCQPGRKQEKLAPVKFFKDEIICNVSRKLYCYTMTDVLQTFDMSIIMKAKDLRTGVILDLTIQWGPSDVAVPNLIREVDPGNFNLVDFWTRQFDRCIKYSDRGFDCRKMVEFYLVQIIKAKARGAIWPSDRAVQYFDGWMEAFQLRYDIMYTWLCERLDEEEIIALDQRLKEAASGC